MGSTASTGIAGAMRKFAALKDYITWFEIPAYNMPRAKAFYDHVYGIAMDTAQVGDFAMAYFPTETGIGGAVVQGPGCLPNDTGALLYLNAAAGLSIMLERVEKAGGRVVMERTRIGDGAGWFALIIDTEGNRLALHERPAVNKPASTKKAAAAKPQSARKAAPSKAKKSLVKKAIKPKAA